MAGVITAGIRLVTVSDTAGFKKFQKSLRDLRIDFLGFDQVAGILDRAGDGFTRFGQIIGGAVVGLVREAAKLDDALMRIVSVSSPSAGINIDNLRKSFLRLTTGLPISAAGLGEVAVEVARAGIESQAAIEKISLVSSKLAAVSDDLTASGAAIAIARISINFGVAAEDMAAESERLSDTLAKLAASGPTTEGAIINVTNRASAAARQLGLTSQELMAFSATVLNTGASAEVAGTALSTTFSRLLSSPQQFATAAGISHAKLKKLLEQGRGFEALQMVFDGLATKIGEGEGSSMRAAAAFKALGIGADRQRRVLVSLVQQHANLQQNLMLSAGSAGELDRRFAIASDSLEKQFETLTAAVSNLKASFGDTLKIFITPVIQGLVAMIQILQSLPAPVKLLIVVFMGLVAVSALVIGATLSMVAAAAAAVIGLTFLLKSLGEAREHYNQLRTATLGAAAAQVAYAEAIAMTGGLDVFTGIDVSGKRRARDAFGGTANAIAEMGRTSPGILGKIARGLFGIELAAGSAGAATAGTGGILSTLGSGLSSIGSFLASWAPPVLAVVAAIGAAVTIVIALKDEFADLFDAMDSLLDPFRLIFVELDKIAQAFGLSGVGGAVIFFVKLALMPLILMMRLTAFMFRVISKAGTTAVGVLFEILNPFIQTILRFRDGLVHIGEAWHRTFGTAPKAIDPVARALEVVGFFVKALMAPLVFVGKLLATVFEVLAGTVFGVIEGVVRGLAPVFDDLILLGNEFSVLGTEIKSVFEAMGFDTTSAGDAFDTFGVVVQGVAATIRLALQPVVLILRVITTLLRVAVMGVRFMLAKMMADLAPILPVLKYMSDLGLRINGIDPKTLNKPNPTPMRAAGDRLKFAFEGVGNRGAWAESPKMAGFASGGITTQGGVVRVHPKEAVIPLDRLPQVMRTVSQPGAGRTGGGGGAFSLTIPVTVTLADVELGRAVAHVSEDEVRRQFGTRGIRLAGIG